MQRGMGTMKLFLICALPKVLMLHQREKVYNDYALRVNDLEGDDSC